MLRWSEVEVAVRVNFSTSSDLMSDDCFNFNDLHIRTRMFSRLSSSSSSISISDTGRGRFFARGSLISRFVGMGDLSSIGVSISSSVSSPLISLITGICIFSWRTRICRSWSCFSTSICSIRRSADATSSSIARIRRSTSSCVRASSSAAGS
jgi:hypothetical protein